MRLSLTLTSLVVNSFFIGGSLHATLKSDYPGPLKDPMSQTPRYLTISDYKKFKGISGNFDELISYALPSPNQEDAGSCLYMAVTGIAEWWLARLNPGIISQSEGVFDLSERFLMNYAGVEEDETQLEDWRTDSIYLYNQLGYGVANTSYRYTKGYYTGTPSADLTPVSFDEEDAEYGTVFNWIDQRDQASELKKIALPKFEREIIFADPEQNQWNIGVAPEDIAETVKRRLKEDKAPVLVVYNQNAYWHAVYVIGYNDHMENENCSYLENFRTRIADRAQRLSDLYDLAETEGDRDYYRVRAERAHQAKEKIEAAYIKYKGCSSDKGVFYIRDSIYHGINEKIYDYDPNRQGEEAPYSAKIVTKSYDWLKYFANHITLIKASEVAEAQE